MRRFLIAATLAGIGVSLLLAATIGSGSPTPQVQQSFLLAFSRGQFSRLVLNPPPKDVHALGSPGLVQEFTSKTDATVNFALVKPDPNVPPGGLDTLQMYGDLYAWFNSVGVATTGYPANDTTACPANNLGTCNYQIFTKNYALFVYTSAQRNLTVRDPFYTEWINDAGISGAFGAAVGAETAVTSISNVQGTEQVFAGGAIFSYPVGSSSPSVYGVADPFNAAFGGAGGFNQLGFPTSEALPVGTGGLIRQTFENGRIEIVSGGTPVVLFSIALVGIAGANQGLNLASGATATLRAAVSDTRNVPVTGRSLTWSTSNGSVVKVTGNGDTATVQAVGPGAANIYVTGEGKTSPPFPVRVGSSCCAIGEGAPSQLIVQAFLAAVDRNHISVALPVSGPVTRSGTGYVQILAGSDGSGVTYIIAEADSSAVAYLVTGDLGAAYLAHGGFMGPLGYPVSDPLSGGVQKFASGAALAGMPVRVIPPSIAARWFQLGGVASAPGLPVADAVAFHSFSGIAGVSQNFTSGTIFGIDSGAASGQAFWSNGAILARYLALSGPAGALGVPLGEVFVSSQAAGGAVLAENFEAGYIDLQPGESTAIEHFNPRHPAISPNPSTIVSGGRVHISATGFAPGATLTFTITGQPGFSVQTATGAFEWDVLTGPGVKPSAVVIQAKAAGGTDTASATYTIISAEAALPSLTIVSGDRQSGLPGGTLTAPLVAVLKDAGGIPLPGIPVSTTASPGAIARSAAITDENGMIAVTLRLPPISGVAVGALTAGGKVANFSALAVPNTIQNFPALTQANSQGALVASLASLILYYQNLGSLATPNGPSTVAAVSQFLSSNHGYSSSETGASLPNPWVAAQFARSGVWIETPTLDNVRDLLNAGTPLALIVNLTLDGVPGGSTSVSAIGVSADASIIIADPNPAFARTSLTGYLNGFSTQGHQIQGALAAVIRVGQAQPVIGSGPFAIASQLSAGASAGSPAGSCLSLDLMDQAIAARAAASPGGVRFQFCDGAQAMYELDFTNSTGATVLDQAGGMVQQLPSDSAAGWSIGRNSGKLTVVPQTISITGVVDSASFGPGLSPGGLITIFGSGFTSGSEKASVTLSGKLIPVLAAFPFQINSWIPADASLGVASLLVTGALGSAAKDVLISSGAPGIFVVGALGAILNQDGTLNSPSSPAQRGQYASIYCAGLGATGVKGGFETVTTATSVVINGTPVTPSFAGLVPGFIGLYQINVMVPANLAPGLAGSLMIREGNQISNTVPFSAQ